MSWQHFERMAADYTAARPPYPRAVWDLLLAEGAIGPGLDVLEVGAGAGLATTELVASGSRVVALEPGPDLAALLAAAVPEAQVLATRLEDADLTPGSCDAAVAATSLHWVDLAVGLPRLHSALRPGGLLAVVRTVFGDDSFATPFRDRVQQLVDARGGRAGPSEPRPTPTELGQGGWFRLVRSEAWPWSITMTTAQVTALFRTFSGWSEEEVRAVGAAADDCGGSVAEHYRTVVHILRRV